MQTRQRRRLRAVLISAVILLWLVIVYKQHSFVAKIQPFPVDHPRHPLPNFDDRNQSELEPLSLPQSSTTTTKQQPDAFFNRIPVTLRRGSPPQSTVRCITPAHVPSNVSWQFRSCKFTNLCLDLQSKTYVIVTNDLNKNDTFVALGGINPRWDMTSGATGDSDKGSWKVRWFPTIRSPSTTNDSFYYQLPKTVVLIPFSSFAGHNVGHLLWDDFYPVFRLLQLFHDDNTNDNKQQLLLIRHVLQEKLYATCDIRRNKRKQCMNQFVKFLPVMGVDPLTFSTNQQVVLTVNNNNNTTATLLPPLAQLVCSQTAVAGMGMLTDHGLHDHGWDDESWTDTLWVPHNLGKGQSFFAFREFLLRHIQVHQEQHVKDKKNRNSQITFSLQSSRDSDRRLNFTRQIQAMQSNVASNATAVDVNAYTLWNMTLNEQVEVALASTIFISACGGASMIATFLPRGSSLILFYNPQGGLDFQNFKSNLKPARLDWDLLNNAAHIRVHWLPITDMDSAENVELFVALIRHELKVIAND